MRKQRRIQKQIWAAGCLTVMFLAGVSPQTVRGEAQVIAGEAREASGPGKLLEEEWQQTQEAEEESSKTDTEEGQAEGWYPYGDGWYYIQADGKIAVDTCTPDGYYVDARGIWRQETVQILSHNVTAPERFLTAEQMGEWKTLLPALEPIYKEIQTKLSGIRMFRVYADAVSYRKIEDTEETELLRLEKNEKNGGYILRIRTDLGDGSRNLTKISAYDYEIFYFLLTQISSTPTRLAEAIYGSWQGNNPCQISRMKETAVGDAAVSYDVEQGCGIYFINPVY